MIEIKWNNAEVLAALERLAQATAQPRPALLAIGESMVESTKKRFETSTAPDGSRWAPNSDTTLRFALHSKIEHRDGSKSARYFNKKGGLNKAGTNYLANKKPLIQSGTLAEQIDYKVNGNGLSIGSTMKYAAMQQFGGTKAKFPNLLGDIPARPFLGVSESDAVMIVDTVNEYLRKVIG